MRRALVLGVPLALLVSVSAAADLTSASHRMRGLHAASGISFGQGDALGPAGSATTLTTVWPGFWPLVAGSFPALDADGDQRPTHLDPDDDGDGLLDVVETGTGTFVSASDTGTSPVDADSDDDGVPDGVEVANGTDPNAAPQVPALPGWAQLGAALLLAPLGARLARRRTR